MAITYRLVFPEDLVQIVPLEAAAFNMKPDQVKKEMRPRIKAYPETFIVAEAKEQVVGYIFGPTAAKRYIEDHLYYDNQPNRPEDPYQAILSLVVAPGFRHQGIGTSLLQAMRVRAHHDHRRALSLTAAPDLVEFYQERGFKNEGPAADLPGGQQFNLIFELKK